jgi:hypothetical protein
MTEQQNYPPNPVQQQPTEPEPPYQNDPAQLLREQQERQRADASTGVQTSQAEPVETGAANESPAPLADPTPVTTPDPTGSGSVQDGGPVEPSGDEPTTLEPVAPGPVVGTDTPPAETGVITAAGTHGSVMVRLHDVLAHVENFLARHPELRALESDLKSGIATIERHGGPAAPVSDTADQQAGNES